MTDFGEHLPAVDVRHLHVEQHEVGLELQVQFQCAAAVGRVHGAQAAAREIGGQDLGDLGFVFGDEDERLGVLPALEGAGDQAGPYV